MKQTRPEPGEWQTDETGRRFRKLGEGCIEYEPTITVDGIEIPQSELAAYHERRRAAEQTAAQHEEEMRRRKEAAALRRNCPFSTGMQSDCHREKCALFLNGCTLAGTSAAKDTAGLICPFNNYKCRTDCALYKGGCTITGLTKRK